MSLLSLFWWMGSFSCQKVHWYPNFAIDWYVAPKYEYTVLSSWLHPLQPFRLTEPLTEKQHYSFDWKLTRFLPNNKNFKYFYVTKELMACDQSYWIYQNWKYFWKFQFWIFPRQKMKPQNTIWIYGLVDIGVDIMLRLFHNYCYMNLEFGTYKSKLVSLILRLSLHGYDINWKSWFVEDC